MSKDSWKYKDETFLCKECMWFVLKDMPYPDPAVSATGRCRRHAPTMGGYPVVYESDWCGDHKLRPQARTQVAS